ncbi:hypothetical protein QFZ30_000277 [Arthrobacter pascens]|nr:hypothetical protein [Arthrobacter pascens]
MKAWLRQHVPKQPSPRASLRICSNNSTLDSIQTRLPAHSSADDSNVEGGATYNRYKMPGESTKWGRA